ncbi:autotransporter domain-containing protein, partial [Lysobacter sp.]|uniref:autotransporter domain-containing protein n=1 Tax=Lysobacter sp. TaxID=72226 RepID=UPI002D5BC54E
DPASTMAFAGGSNAFAVTGAPLERNVALIEAGAAYQLSPRTSISVGYRGALEPSTEDQGAELSLRVKF